MIRKHIWSVITGLIIRGKDAPYPVLNERSIRATAWLLFAIGISIMRYTIFSGDRIVMHRVVPIFWWHFVISSAWGPAYSPIAWIGQWLVVSQQPEYVWAVQKRFARSLGAVMATIMMILVFIFPSVNVWPLIICIICLLLMRLESAVWLCIGCKLYYALISWWLITQPDNRPACPWGACERKPSKTK